MRLITDFVVAFASRGFWRRHFTDQYAVLLADIGLSPEEQRTLLELRRTR